jgi:tetratricopeptide (TPR) repeat protein
MRIRPHVLEDESRNAFREIIISFGWVYCKQEPDYGLDEQIQIFKNGEPTQYYFFAQLKGSDRIPENEDSPNFDFKTKRILQYKENPLPVMLVLFDSKGKRIFYEWISSFMSNSSPDLMRKLHFQKTVRIRFEKRLDTLDASIIKKEVRHQYFNLGYFEQSIPNEFVISLSINFPESFKSKLLSEIKQWLKNDRLSNFIKIKKIKTPDGKIEIDREPYTLTIFEDRKPIKVSLHKGSEEKFSLDDLIATLKVSIAMTLSGCGLTNRALDLVRRIVFEEHPLSFDAKLLLALPSLPLRYAKLNRVAEAMEVSEQLLKRGYHICAQVISSSALFYAKENSRFYYQHYRRFLKTAIEEIKDRKARGSLYYNLANNLRSDSFFREAISHYNKAAKANPSYRKRSYWWAELGGCFFLLNKFAWSERFYRKAVELGEKVIPVRALLGDALLHKGRFREARTELGIYLNKTDIPKAEFVLKRWLACFLFRRFGNALRNTSKAIELVEVAIKAKKKEKRFILLNEALKTDPLCGLGWFNFAVYQSKEERRNRYWEWLITAIIQNWDIEAWANTILLMITEEIRPPLYLAMAALHEGFRLHGVSLEEEMRMRVCSHFVRKGKDVNEFISLIAKMASELDYTFSKYNPIIIRFFQ